MTAINLDRNRIRGLFDLRRRANGGRYVAYADDPYPAFHRLRDSGPVHEGTKHVLIGYTGSASFHGVPDPDRRHFTIFSFAECKAIYCDDELWRSAPADVPADAEGVGASMLYMYGAEHRRHRALVRPSFVPAKARWWIENWINETVHTLIDGFETDGRADLNVDFAAAIPVLTITGSFGLSVDQALDVRALEGFDGPSLFDLLEPIVAARRADSKDDLISVLCQAELKGEDGSTHRLSDAASLTFAFLLLHAGSGTTWKQMGITLVGMLTTPDALDAVYADRSLLRNAVEESRVGTSPTRCLAATTPHPHLSPVCRFRSVRSSKSASARRTGIGALGEPRQLQRASGAAGLAWIRERTAHLPRAARGPRRDGDCDQRVARSVADRTSGSIRMSTCRRSSVSTNGGPRTSLFCGTQASAARY